MQTINIIRGRLIGPTTVELDEPVLSRAPNAEVWLRFDQMSENVGPDVLEFLRGLPPGRATTAELDARVRAEKDQWEGR